MEIVRGGELPVWVNREKSNRVKLLNLADFAQAVWHKRGENYLELKLYGFDSQDKEVQFVAPFTFDSEEARDETFSNDEKLTDFANAVFVTQMLNIDPELDTQNFKK
jgi:hypothetical protein